MFTIVAIAALVIIGLAVVLYGGEAILEALDNDRERYQ